MNYLSKKNFGVPGMILAALSVLMGYGLYAGSFSLLWVTLAFAGIIYLFDFDDFVKGSFRQSMLVAFYGWIVKLLINMMNTVLDWFSGAATGSRGMVGSSNVFSSPKFHSSTPASSLMLISTQFSTISVIIL